ncbi:phosphatase [Lithospermum erythrorhizon]|uniref:Phosphatase n=1 Tax=Lithospermum erythrorhizon TaxID=34254 RepID=A0AAV3RZY7_LITER
MSTNVPPPLPTALNGNNNLFASIDMGSNSFKLLIVQVDPSTSHFLTLECHKKHDILISRHVPSAHSRFIATSAIRESANKSQFIYSIHETLGIQVDVLSGSEEARLIYLGVLQFHQVYNNMILTIDIGGGSMEFVIGHQDKILYSISLQLGHLTLTKIFPKVKKMQEHIRSVIFDTDLVSQVKEYNIEKVIGLSGTMRKIEKTVFKGYTRELEEHVQELDEFHRDWSFNQEDLKRLVKIFINEEKEKGVKKRRNKFF